MLLYVFFNSLRVIEDVVLQKANVSYKFAITERAREGVALFFLELILRWYTVGDVKVISSVQSKTINHFQVPLSTPHSAEHHYKIFTIQFYSKYKRRNDTKNSYLLINW